VIRYATVSLLRNVTEGSIQFFIIYVPSQQPNGQLQTQHSLDTDNYIIYKLNYRQALVEEEKKLIIAIINSINSVKIFSLRVLKKNIHICNN
jgi:hypothetical protein